MCEDEGGLDGGEWTGLEERWTSTEEGQHLWVVMSYWGKAMLRRSASRSGPPPASFPYMIPLPLFTSSYFQHHHQHYVCSCHYNYLSYVFSFIFVLFVVTCSSLNVCLAPSSAELKHVTSNNALTPLKDLKSDHKLSTRASGPMQHRMGSLSPSSIPSSPTSV